MLCTTRKQLHINIDVLSNVFIFKTEKAAILIKSNKQSRTEKIKIKPGTKEFFHFK